MATDMPVTPGPLTPGAIIKPTVAAAPAPTGPLGVQPSLQAEKFELVKKIKTLQTDVENKVKWWSFCKVHGDGKMDPGHHDTAFLATFIEAFEAGEVVEEPGCPFRASAGGGDSWGGGKGGGGGCGGGCGGGGGGGFVGGPKIFVGGLPKDTPEAAVWEHFGYFGTVTEVQLKWDPETGKPRGFGFVTFQDPSSAKAVLDNYDGNMMNGKWIDCKAADQQDGKGGGKGKGDKGKGKGGFDKGYGKGGGDKGWGKGGGDSWGKGGGKDFGKGGGKMGGAPKGGGKGGDESGCKVFIGGMPRTASLETVGNLFSQYGSIANIDLKYDEQGGFRGFGFVTFTSPGMAHAAMGGSNQMDGKWLDCKPATAGDKGGGKGGDKGGKGKGFGKDSGKGYGKDSGKGYGKDKGGYGKSGGGPYDKGGKGKGGGDWGKGGGKGGGFGGGGGWGGGW